jgi:hypothetical protein
LALRPYAVLAPVSRGCPPPLDTSLRVTHPSATDGRNHPCDLHVLSMPPAFTLSQDQTLKFISSPPSQSPAANLEVRPNLLIRSLPSNPVQPISQPTPENPPLTEQAQRQPRIPPPPQLNRRSKSKTPPTNQTRPYENHTIQSVYSRKPDAIFNQHSKSRLNRVTHHPQTNKTPTRPDDLPGHPRASIASVPERHPVSLTNQRRGGLIGPHNNTVKPESSSFLRRNYMSASASAAAA